MIKKQSSFSQIEYKEKSGIKKYLSGYYLEQANKNGLKSMSKINDYLPESLKSFQLKRNIVFAHLDFERIIDLIAYNKEFTVISGLNPSSPLHLGNKVLFDLLIFFQKLGGRVYIPVTNDESYIDDKTHTLSKSKEIAYQEIIPSIISFDFDPDKTHIFVDSDYPDLYNFAMYLSKYISISQLKTIFGQNSLNNIGQIFYRGAVQIAQILLPQLPEFGGPKHTLIPVGIDQHPYVLLARDVAKKVKMIPPSEIVFKFLPSLKNPIEKMSGSKPNTAIYLNEKENEILKKINSAYTGSLTIFEEHKKFGGIPEICSVFSLLNYLNPNDVMIDRIYKQYQSGSISMTSLKQITNKYIRKMILEHQKKKSMLKKSDINKYLLNKSLKSILM